MTYTTHRRKGTWIAVVALAWGAVFAAGSEAIHHVRIGDEHRLVAAVGYDGTDAFTLTIDEWIGWAESHLEDALGGPVRIGEVEMPPESFHGFAVAGLAPDGRRMLVVPTTYAMLTTVSVPTVVDPVAGTLAAVATPAFGDVETLVWSPDGSAVAYALGSARAFGDGLRVDDLEALRPLLELDARTALASDALAVHAVTVDAFEWLPAFRDLVWHDDGTLTFVSHDPALGAEAGDLRWRFDPVGEVLTIE